MNTNVHCQELTYSGKASERNSPSGVVSSSYPLHLTIFFLQEAFADSPTCLPVSFSSGLTGPSYACAIKVAPSHLVSDASIPISALLRQFYSANILKANILQASIFCNILKACLCQAQWLDTEMNQTQPQRTYT